VCGTSLGEGRLQFTQALSCHTIPNPVIRVDDNDLLLLSLGIYDLGFQRDDLCPELTSLLSGSRFLERLGGEFVLLLTRNTKVAGDVLGDAQGDQTVFSFLVRGRGFWADS
jgi:hypothetical protein